MHRRFLAQTVILDARGAEAGGADAGGADACGVEASGAEASDRLAGYFLAPWAARKSVV